MLQLLQLGTGPGAGSQQLRFPICLGQGDGDVPMLTASQRHVWFLGSRIVYVVNSLCHDLFFFFLSIDSGLAQIECHIIYRTLIFL